MNDLQKKIIYHFAQGNNSLRDDAIRIHRTCIESDGVRGNNYQRFMAEVDHPSPDYVLRGLYHKDLVEEYEREFEQDLLEQAKYA